MVEEEELNEVVRTDEGFDGGLKGFLAGVTLDDERLGVWVGFYAALEFGEDVGVGFGDCESMAGDGIGLGREG